MFIHSNIHKIWTTLCLLIGGLFAFGQNIDCNRAAVFTQEVADKTERINTQDPEIITLHYLFVLDLLDSIHVFQNQYLPNLHFCPQVDFFAALHQCNALNEQLMSLKDTLERQRKRVDTLFFQQAVEEMHFTDTAMADYYLDRSLQFNRLNSYSLIYKLHLRYAQRNYDECTEILRLIYSEVPLSREQENELSDFNTEFYATLYHKGDSLVKAGHEADALALFETLETFCHDLPSSYCNDDYYHGIIRSKSGVYESYLTISKVAWERKNPKLAYKFLDYAKAYLLENEDEIIISDKFVKYIEEMEARRYNYHFNPE